MKVFASTIALVLLGALVIRPILAGPTAPRPAAEHAGLDGARSTDELVGELIVALNANDAKALRNLRMSEREYREVVVPGSNAPGEPPRQFTDEWKDLLWGSYDTKSSHRERDLLANLGGKALTLRKASFAGGERAYRGYNAHRQLVVDCVDGAGNDVTIPMGAIAEVDGRFKFLAFGRD